MALTSGTRLGPYEIIEHLGTGGMGEVYRARDPRLGREVALKILPDAFARDGDRLARFEREARTVAGLSHPNIVTLFSIEADAGARFLTMELVEGRTLDRLVVAGGLPLPRVLELVIPLADALAAAHAKGVVHRDLKPANVMVTREGRVKVLDFGLAKPVEDSLALDATRAVTVEAPLSGAGLVFGTIPYMAPEQLRGEPVDARTDLFAFGIILYELATGRRPFAGATFADVSSAILRDPPPTLAGVRHDTPSDLDRIARRCLEKAPRDRFQSALEVHGELRLLERELERAAVSSPGRAAGKPSIAVLPFSNMSADPENEYFSDGLSEELLNVLAKIPDLKVTGRTSSFAFKGKNEDLRDIGHPLGVGTLLEGSVRKAGNRVRITAQLIKVEDGFHLWSETYDRVLDDIFAVQDDIARAVSSALHVTLLGKFTAPSKQEAECYPLILQANHLVLQNTGPALAKAVLLYREAIDKCPDDARAWAGMARAFTYQAFYGHGDVTDCRRRARQAAERALALDDGLADGHDIMGMILGSLEFRWKEMFESIRKARALAPGASDPMVTLGVYEACFGRLEEGLQLVRRAREIDPLNPHVHMHYARLESWVPNLDAARGAYSRALELSPGIASVHASLGLMLLRLGMGEKAIEEIQREPPGGYRNWALAVAHHELGRPHESDSALERLIAEGEQWAYQIACVHAARGEADAAFHWLERAYQAHDSGIVLARMTHFLEGLHANPRWPIFLQKIGLVS